jgi:hypothetical protein
VGINGPDLAFSLWVVYGRKIRMARRTKTKKE